MMFVAAFGSTPCLDDLRVGKTIGLDAAIIGDWLGVPNQ